MDQVGFISDKLDIKLLILYIAARLIGPVNLETLADLTMCDGGVDYFSFTECLNELIKTEHMKRTDDELYCITAKGVGNSQVCESSLPYSVRLIADKNVNVYNQKLRRKGLVKSSVAPRANGTYTVSLSLSDDVDNIMSLNLMVTKQEMAGQLAEHFQKHAEDIYNSILDSLLAHYDDKGGKMK
jgi:hypothetical protein